jgi:hypothetical protein
MNRITSNIKHFALSLLIVGLAFATQSFINYSEKKEISKVASTYYQVSEGHYTITPPSGVECAQPSDNPCKYQFSGNPSVSSFDLPNIPTDGGTATPQDEGYTLP